MQNFIELYETINRSEIACISLHNIFIHINKIK